MLGLGFVFGCRTVLWVGLWAAAGSFGCGLFVVSMGTDSGIWSWTLDLHFMLWALAITWRQYFSLGFWFVIGVIST